MSVNEGRTKNDSLILRKIGSWRYMMDKTLKLPDTSSSSKLAMPYLKYFTELQTVQSSQATSVYQAKLVSSDRFIPVFIKQFHFRSKTDRCKHLVRKSRALRAVEADDLLHHHGLVAPRTLIVGWQQTHLIKNNFFTVTIALEGYKNIYDQISTVSGQGKEAKREFIIALAKEIATLHRAKISHGDMRAGNILSKYDNTWKFAFIDNERTKKHLRLPTNIRVKNLVQLNLLLSPNISRADRLRFFKTYCNDCFGAFNRDLLTRVLKKTRRRMVRLLSTNRIEQSDIWL